MSGRGHVCRVPCDGSFGVMLLLSPFCLEETEARSSLMAHSPPSWVHRGLTLRLGRDVPQAQV